MKNYYVKYSSWFDTNKYPIDLIKSTIKETGCGNVWVENQFGWSNQPEVVVFESDESEVENISNKIQKVLGTKWIIISEKDWNKVSTEDKVIIKETAKKWANEQRKMIRDAEDDLKSKLAEKGMIINEVDKAPFIAKVQPVWKEYEEIFGKDFIQLIDKYRK